MKHRTVLLAALAAALCTCLVARPAAAQLWWERGADKWYYKDDWKGQAISAGRNASAAGGFTTILATPGEAASGWIVVWGERGYTLWVNDRQVGSCADGGLIDHFDLTAHVEGAQTVTLRIAGSTVCAEGEIVGADGKRYAFATGPEWKTTGGGEVRATAMTVAESGGAYNSARNGTLMTYNAEERGKSAIAKALARIQRLNEQGIYELRRYRPAGEILSFDEATAWRRAEAMAGPLLARAEKDLRGEAIPAQKAGRFDDAIAVAGRAGVDISAAELAVGAVTDLYRAERLITHIENVLSVLSDDAPDLRADIHELHALAAGARTACRLNDWGGCATAARRIENLASQLRTRIELAAAGASRPLVGGVGQLDEFPEDQFAWFNARDLMGNDPARWPFSVSPSDSRYIDLGGMWDFRTDPDNIGEAEGWSTGESEGWKPIFAPLPWERQGYGQDNLKAPRAPIGNGTTGRDKPYNGFAWYRKSVVIPAEWEAQPVVLVIGDVLNWHRVFVNGKPVGPGVQRPGRIGPFNRFLVPHNEVVIPADLIAFGQVNTIAVQVYNHDRFGGIVGGPIALYAKPDKPDARQTPGPLSFVDEIVYPTTVGAARQTLYAGTMSPAIIVATDRHRLDLWGWQARGYALPSQLLLPSAAGMRTIDLNDAGVSMRGPQLSEQWLLIRGESTETLVVFERQPESIRWARNAQQQMGLTIEFPAGPACAAILNLPPDAKLDKAACRFWAGAVRSYPVSASEVVTPAPGKAGAWRDAGMQRCTIRYNYWPLGADASSNQPVAPLPMLASFALQSQYPGLQADDVAQTAYRSRYCAYLVASERDSLTYLAPAVDRSKVTKGVGELFGRRRAQDNVHGGLGEKEMFQRMAEWGFDHCRYALAFDADWDLPLVDRMGGKITDDEAVWQRLDEFVANCNAAGMQMMLCSFTEIDSRRWLARPELEANTIEMWRRIAGRYADLPAWAISYDFFNEPAYMHRDHWNRIAAKLTAAVRSVDKTHTVVWQPADGWAQPFWCLWMEPVDDDNVLYSFHHYGKHWGYAYDEYYPGYRCTWERTMADAYLEAILFGIRHHAPIHCGEFGISIIQPEGDGEAWLNDHLGMFERFGIGWNWWNYDGGNIYRTGLAAGPDRVSPLAPILSKWMSRSGWGATRRAAGEMPPLQPPQP